MCAVTEGKGTGNSVTMGESPMGTDVTNTASLSLASPARRPTMLRLNAQPLAKASAAMESRRQVSHGGNNVTTEPLLEVTAVEFNVMWRMATSVLETIIKYGLVILLAALVPFAETMLYNQPIMSNVNPQTQQPVQIIAAQEHLYVEIGL